jgi:hypothetical protein
MKNEGRIACAAYFGVDDALTNPDRQRPVSEFAAPVPKAFQPLMCGQRPFSAD